jgi:2'-5' RNA ligase
MRMFVAVWPDEAATEALSSLDLATRPGLRVVGPDGWHVTLRFLGDVDDRLVPSLAAALGTAARSVRGPVQAVLGPASAWFAGGRVLQVPVNGLDHAADAVRSATVPLMGDTGTAEPPFVGHLTVARAGPGRPDAGTRSALAGIPCTSTFPVDALHLVGSRRTPDGTRYTTLASAPLAAG